MPSEPLKLEDVGEEIRSPSSASVNGSNGVVKSEGLSESINRDETEDFPSNERQASSDAVKSEDPDMGIPNFDSDASPALQGEGSRNQPMKSKSPTPPSSLKKSKSESSTPPPTASNGRKKAPKAPIQLIGDLPVAREDALATFNEIIENNYQYKTLGRSREALESMTCDCGYQAGTRSVADPCGPKSDCINRLTQVECLSDDCRWGTKCQNQRFQNREYANIQIVLTEKKGYGLRAESDIPKDSFIYEYVGDVVSPSSFKKRMRDYANEGIQHFYFMMLQKDEFIDATKSGGIGRFANHSCNPNCYVAKWTVGDYVRMGIFAKRNIQRFEEITFNYNVDRYGHQAQTCYCGEPNCVGFIGGKTQTDVAVMDDLLLDALGITDEAEIMELKGTKKKKGKKIDDPDFLPSVKPISENDAPTLIAAIRQTPSRKVLIKVLTRIKITDDQAALRQIMRLRGYSLMTNLLNDYSSDSELLSLILETIDSWPLMNRNKVDDSKIGAPVQAISENESFPTSLRERAQKLLEHWETLPTYKRIAKRSLQDGDQVVGEDVYIANDEGYRSPKRHREDLFFSVTKLQLAPVLTREPVPPPLPEVEPEPYRPQQPPMYTSDAIKLVIAQAAQQKAAEAEEAAQRAAEASAAAAAKALAREERKKAKEKKKTISPQEKEALKEKQLHKLISPIVVKCLSKYSKSMDSATFKKHAKELTQIIAEKEKKSASYKENRLDKLSDDKAAKMTKFAKEYVTKIVHKIKKANRNKDKAPSSALLTPSTSTSAQTPDSIHGVDIEMGDDAEGVSISMDIESDEDGSDEEDHLPHENGQLRTPTSPMQLVSPLEPTPSTPASHRDHDHVSVLTPADPRRRPPMDSPGTAHLPV